MRRAPLRPRRRYYHGRNYFIWLPVTPTGYRRSLRHPPQYFHYFRGHGRLKWREVWSKSANQVINVPKFAVFYAVSTGNQRWNCFDRRKVMTLGPVCTATSAFLLPSVQVGQLPRRRRLQFRRPFRSNRGGGHVGRSAPRLAVLRRLAFLDAPTEQAFDRLATRLAARSLHAPVAVLSLVGGNRSFFKSSVGLPEPWSSQRGMPLEYSVCQHLIASMTKPIDIVCFLEVLDQMLGQDNSDHIT